LRNSTGTSLASEDHLESITYYVHLKRLSCVRIILEMVNLSALPKGPRDKKLAHTDKELVI
jgi:hypothetical protein